jgi:hypothetical protein
VVVRLGVGELVEGGGMVVSFGDERLTEDVGDREKNHQGEGFMTDKVVHDSARTNRGSMRGQWIEAWQRRFIDSELMRWPVATNSCSYSTVE